MPDPNNTVLHEHRMVFMMIAKAGNTSTMHALRSACGLEVRPDHHFPNAGKEEIAERYGAYLKVAFVRNPFDRLVSCWCDKVRRKWLPSLQRQGLRKDMSFPAFVEQVARVPDSECPGAAQHFRSQTYDLCIGDRVVPDFVGRIDTFAHDWKRMRELIKGHCGVDMGPVRHANASQHRPYRSYYTPELRRLVERRFADDLEVFGYSF